MPQTIQLKRGLNANFGPISLLAGEPAFVTDTGKFYIGDGTQKVLINPTYGTAANANTGTSAGNVPVLDAGGKLVSSVIPSIAITETYVVSSQSAMLALAANVGDVAVRTDINSTFILQTEPATSLANWVQLLAPGVVQSVNGQTGVVTLNGSQILITGYTMAGTAAALAATDSINVALGKLEKTDTLKAPLASPTFTGTVAAPTPATADNSTTVATTAFVKAQGYLTSAPVTSVNTKTGVVVLDPRDLLMTGYAIGSSAAAIATTDSLSVAIGKLEYGKAPLASPNFSGTPTAPTLPISDNTTKIATTAFVKSQGYATLAAPTFTGAVNAPTPTAGDNSTLVATTAFVTNAIANITAIDGGTF